jgi:hypothetical protein
VAILAWHSQPPGPKHYQPLSEFETERQIQERVAKLMPPDLVRLDTTVPMNGIFCKDLMKVGAAASALNVH